MNVDGRLRRLEKALGVDTAAAGAPGGVTLIPELERLRPDLEARARAWAAAHGETIRSAGDFFRCLSQALAPDPEFKAHVGRLLDRQREASRRP